MAVLGLVLVDQGHEWTITELEPEAAVAARDGAVRRFRIGSKVETAGRQRGKLGARPGDVERGQRGRVRPAAIVPRSGARRQTGVHRVRRQDARRDRDGAARRSRRPRAGSRASVRPSSNSTATTCSRSWRTVARRILTCDNAGDVPPATRAAARGPLRRVAVVPVRGVRGSGPHPSGGVGAVGRPGRLRPQRRDDVQRERGRHHRGTGLPAAAGRPVGAVAACVLDDPGRALLAVRVQPALGRVVQRGRRCRSPSCS